MLEAIDGHRAAARQRRAQAVGAGHVLGPQTALHDAGVRAAAKAVVGVEVEDHAVVVGKGEQEVAAGDLLHQRLEFGQRELAREADLVAPPRKIGTVHNLDARRGGDVQPGLGAAHPAVEDVGWRQPVGRHRRAARPHRPCVGQHALTAWCHVRCLLSRSVGLPQYVAAPRGTDN